MCKNVFSTHHFKTKINHYSHHCKNLSRILIKTTWTTPDTVSKLQKSVFYVNILTPKCFIIFFTSCKQISTGRKWVTKNQKLHNIHSNLFESVVIYRSPFHDNAFSGLIKNRINAFIDSRWMIMAKNWNYIKALLKDKIIFKWKLSNFRLKTRKCGVWGWDFSRILWCYFSRV